MFGKTLKAMVAAGLAMILLCSCDGGSSSDVAAEELLTAAADSGSTFEEMEAVSESDIKYYFDIEADWYKDFAAEIAGNQAFADEIVVVKAASSDKVKDIEKALEARIESRKSTLESYAAAEYDKLCKSSVETKGDYVYLIVGSDTKKAEKALEKLL